MLSPLIQEKPYMAIVSISASTHHLRHLYHHTTNPLLHRHHHCFSPLPQSSFTGSSSSSSSRSAFQEEARRRYACRIQVEYKEEMEPMMTLGGFPLEERIRRMQSVFNREKNKYRRGYERWREEEEDGAYHQRFQRDDCRSRTTPYTNNEIKSAFRSKAMQYHPDQNQENKGKFSSFWVCVIFWLSSYVGTYLWWSYLHWLT
ncbi:hypothetical protein LXL04_001600 [Taraxacum kok-saghyz]